MIPIFIYAAIIPRLGNLGAGLLKFNLGAVMIKTAVVFAPVR